MTNVIVTMADVNTRKFKREEDENESDFEENENISEMLP
jgi:hypothetical protein